MKSLKVIKSAEQLREEIAALKKRGKRIGFVPTMGALHKGHVSLIKRARRENDCVVVSIFVNPTQFGPKEDFKHYPRPLTQDKKILKREGASILFLPSQEMIYPKGFCEFIEPGPLARYLCGPKRPGHFRGVATVVHRLFEIVKPDTAYFGMKDFQQLRVIEAMVSRLGLPVYIKRCPTVREPGGLAMSSRNRYLSPKHRVRALAIYRALLKARRLIRGGERNPIRVKKAMRGILLSSVDRIDYAEVVNPKTLAPLRRMNRNVLAAVACFVGPARLIDNILMKV